MHRVGGTEKRKEKKLETSQLQTNDPRPKRDVGMTIPHGHVTPAECLLVAATMAPRAETAVGSAAGPCVGTGQRSAGSDATLEQCG